MGVPARVRVQMHAAVEHHAGVRLAEARQRCAALDQKLATFLDVVVSAARERGGGAGWESHAEWMACSPVWHCHGFDQTP